MSNTALRTIRLRCAGDPLGRSGIELRATPMRSLHCAWLQGRDASAHPGRANTSASYRFQLIGSDAARQKESPAERPSRAFVILGAFVSELQGNLHLYPFIGLCPALGLRGQEGCAGVPKPEAPPNNRGLS
jgi:hypothetical protein